MSVVGGSATGSGSPNGLLARGVFAHGAGLIPIPASRRGEAFIFMFEHLTRQPAQRFSVHILRDTPAPALSVGKVTMAKQWPCLALFPHSNRAKISLSC